jgi:glycogen phosphorylase
MTQKNKDIEIAYFSMEIAIDDNVPNFAGGLGVLAADILHSCADLEMPVAGVSLIYHQSEDLNESFVPEKYFKKLPTTVFVQIENRQVQINVYLFEITGKTGFKVPIYFLSTNSPQNPRWDRDLTKHLYADDRYTRMGQEYILGVGGAKILDALGHTKIKTYHMNEGHSAFLTLELLKKFQYDENKVRSKCTFTTHTPIAAGHDYFDYDLAYRTIRDVLPLNIKQLATEPQLGMTQLAMSLSKKSNSVSKKHNAVCKKMFPGSKFTNITNGIYHPRWICDCFQKLFDQYLPGWEADPSIFDDVATLLPVKKLVDAKHNQKKKFISWINKNANFFPFNDKAKDDDFDPDTLTMGFARRFVPYKRPDLIFYDIDRLRKIGYNKLQLVFATHCFPYDAFCNNTRDHIRKIGFELRGQIKIVIIPDYNLEIAKKMVSGCDAWLNNPMPPLEASGTSGMKAALNGCLNFSVADGWWDEAPKMLPNSGWAFDRHTLTEHDMDSDYDDAGKLLDAFTDLLDCYYNRKDEWMRRIKESLKLMAYFNTHRAVREYKALMWDK